MPEITVENPIPEVESIILALFPGERRAPNNSATTSLLDHLGPSVLVTEESSTGIHAHEALPLFNRS
jgi:hypothetical protein